MADTKQPITLVLREEGAFLGGILLSPEDFTNISRDNDAFCYEFVDSTSSTKISQSEVPKHLRSILENLALSTLDSPAQLIASSLVVNCSKVKLVFVVRKGFEKTLCNLFPNDNMKSFVMHNPLPTLLENLHNIIGFCKIDEDKHTCGNFFLDPDKNLWNDLEANDVLMFAYSNNKTKESGKLENPVNLNLKTITGGSYSLACFVYETVESFSQRVEFVCYPKASTDGIRIVYEGQQLKGLQLQDYNIDKDCTLYVTLIGRGGGGHRGFFLPVDLANPSICLATASLQIVSGFQKGLNIVGYCHNYNCALKNVTQYIPKGFPDLLIILDNNSGGKCARCEEIILIDTFLVHKARVKFVFKKTEQRDKSQMLEIENAGNEHYLYDSDEWQTTYTTLKLSESKVPQWYTYDFIAIYTVSFELSFNKCQKCGKEILINEEVKSACGRAFHQKCLQNPKNCDICNTAKYSLNQLPQIVGSTGSRTLTLDIPNQIYGNCFSTHNYQPQQVCNFLRDVSLHQQNISAFERQSDFVISKLPELIRNTTVNTMVLATLRQQSIISDDDEAKLASITERTMQVREIYRIVSTREKGLEILLKALEETNQSSAVLILKQFKD